MWFQLYWWKWFDTTVNDQIDLGGTLAHHWRGHDTNWLRYDDFQQYSDTVEYYVTLNARKFISSRRSRTWFLSLEELSVTDIATTRKLHVGLPLLNGENCSIVSAKVKIQTSFKILNPRFIFSLFWNKKGRGLLFYFGHTILSIYIRIWSNFGIRVFQLYGQRTWDMSWWKRCTYDTIVAHYQLQIQPIGTSEASCQVSINDVSQRCIWLPAAGGVFATFWATFERPRKNYFVRESNPALVRVKHLY